MRRGRSNISEAEFVRALRQLPRPSANILKILRAHASADGKAMTASNLATVAGYESYRAVNAQYGGLAARIGRTLNRRMPCWIELLVEGVRPKSQTNDQWVLVMRSEFANALRTARWID